jgi:hypothetical protein
VRNASIAYLQAFVTLLVLLHHSVIAYSMDTPLPTTTFLQPPLLWRAFPIVDTQFWSGFGLFVLSNDLFFMSLMFFISGLFVLKSLQRKGAVAFLRDRLFRLGIPFVVGVALLMPLAYYPAYLNLGGEPGFMPYVNSLLKLLLWPSGPLWFLWVLFVFDIAAAVFYKWLPGLGTKISDLLKDTIAQQPLWFFVLLVIASSIVYIPVTFFIGFDEWYSFGPFAVQASRFLHYAIYFLAGSIIGGYGLEQGILSAEGNLAKRWKFWASIPIPAFMFFLFLFGVILEENNLPTYLPEIIGGLAWEISCAATCLALIALFVRFARKPLPLLNNFSENAYGMYVFHYVYVIWLQYALLDVNMSGLSKGLLVSVAVVGLSWATSAILPLGRLHYSPPQRVHS